MYINDSNEDLKTFEGGLVEHRIAYMLLYTYIYMLTFAHMLICEDNFCKLRHCSLHL